MQQREKWAGDMYAKYPKPEDWENIRFSDEVHAGYSPEGHLWIVRKRGKVMRYRRDNIQYRDPPPQRAPPSTCMGGNWVEFKVKTYIL